MRMSTEKIILFDGDCSFCDSTVSFLFDHNSKRTLYFTSQQSERGQQILKEHELPTSLDTIYYYEKGRIYEKAEAFFAIAEELDGIWKYFKIFKRIVPKRFANWCYDRVAKRRHLIFGQKNTCRLMTPEERHYFLM